MPPSFDSSRALKPDRRSPARRAALLVLGLLCLTASAAGPAQATQSPTPQPAVPHAAPRAAPRLAAACAATHTGLVDNGGFEQTCAQDPASPAGWGTFSSGTTAATFGIAGPAYQGTHAATTTVTAVDPAAGEAGWTTAVVAPRGNQHYTLRFEQQGSTYLYAYVVMVLADGSTAYQSLMSVPETQGAWSRYHDSFVSPTGVVSMQLVLATSGIGTMTVDDVSLSREPAPVPSSFATAMVSLSFDDGQQSSYDNGLPVLRQHGLPATFFVNGSTLDTSGYLTSGEVRSLAGAGDEIGSHSYDHVDLVGLPDSALHRELNRNDAVLQRLLGPADIDGFATPYGSFTSHVVGVAMATHRYVRDTDGQLNTAANLDTRQIHARLVRPSTTQGTFDSWVAEAARDKAWLVLVYHGISDTPDPEQDSSGEGYTIPPAQLSAEMASLTASGVSVRTIDGALDAVSVP